MAGEVKMAEARITQEMIEEMRSKIGLRLRTEDAVFMEEAAYGAIRRFGDGVGDPNPLWLNKQYAKKILLFQI